MTTTSNWADWVNGVAGDECRAENIGKVPAPRVKTIRDLYGAMPDLLADNAGRQPMVDLHAHMIDEALDKSTGANWFDIALKRARRIKDLEYEVDSLQKRIVDDRRAADVRLSEENARGGEARYVVAAVASFVGIDLSDKDMIGGERWHPTNMARVEAAVNRLRNEHSALERHAAAVQVFVGEAQDKLLLAAEYAS